MKQFRFPTLGLRTCIAMAAAGIMFAIFDLGGKPTPFVQTVGIFAFVLWAVESDRKDR